MTHPSSLRIAIVGAGPGGLTLARILQIHGIQAMVYERETSRHARGQGGSLDLHTESGQRALREARLEAEFLTIARPEGQMMRILDKTGQVLLHHAAEPGVMARPEVDRTALRDILLDSLHPETVRWDHQLAQLVPLPGDRFQLQFKNGQTAEADLVVGADGGRSRVRPLLSDASLSYTGVTFIDADIAHVRQTHPALAQLVGTGNIFALGDGKGIVAHYMGDGSLSAYLALQVPEDWITTCGIPFREATAARAALLTHFADWSPDLTDLIRYCDAPLMPLQIHMLPVGHRWQHQPGVTLIGDAAHLMSPFAGEGVNLAMLDALELALVLTQTDDVPSAIRASEEAMFERAAQASAESIANQHMCFSPDGAQQLTAMMSQYR